MANVLSNYIPEFFAMEGIRWLKSQDGYLPRISRQYDDERRAFNKGDKVKIKRRGTFVAQEFGAITAGEVTPQDIQAQGVTLTFGNPIDVTYAVVDGDFAKSDKAIIRDHIEPAMNALAVKLNQNVNALQSAVGPAFKMSSPATVEDLTKIWQRLQEEHTPDGPWSAALSPAQIQPLLKDVAFSQLQGAGQVGVDTQITGRLGPKYNFDIFPYTGVAASQGATNNVTVLAYAINSAAGYPAGTKTIDIDEGGGSAGAVAFSAGHTLKITHADGTINSYRVQATNTPTTGDFTGVQIEPGLRSKVLDNAVVTLVADGNNQAATTVGLAFHRDALAIVMAPLPEDCPGTETFVARDEENGIFLRVQTGYDLIKKTKYISIDCLAAVAVLNGHMAVRLIA